MQSVPITTDVVRQLPMQSVPIITDVVSLNLTTTYAIGAYHH